MVAKRGPSQVSKAPKAKKCRISGYESLPLHKIYGIQFPEYFFQFYNFCKEVEKENPLDALLPLDLMLIGPFQYIEEKTSEKSMLDPCHYHMIWRHYYDPPECLPLLVDNSGGQFHLSLLTDDPNCSSHSVIVSNDGKSCELKLAGDNLFTSVGALINAKIKKVKEASEKTALKKLNDAMKNFCSKHNIKLDSHEKCKARLERVASRTLHGAGIVIKERNGCGYREVFTTSEIKKHMKGIVNASNDEDRRKRFAPLIDIITHLQFADDETDFGSRLEFGIDLFCHGSFYFHKMAAASLKLAYTLLDRPLYAQIIEKHLSDRRKENVSRK